jgi:hypothetical protein
VLPDEHIHLRVWRGRLKDLRCGLGLGRSMLRSRPSTPLRFFSYLLKQTPTGSHVYSRVWELLAEGL